MGQSNRMLGFIVVISLFAGCIPSFGQSTISSNDDIQLGSVWFKGKCSNLTKEAKKTLDIFIKQIQSNSALQVRAISFSKDLCDKCGERSWKRTTVILKYLSKHGVSENRLISTNRLEGELNKVDIYLTASVSDSPHPAIKKRDK